MAGDALLVLRDLGLPAAEAGLPAIQTGLVLRPAIIGILLSSAAAQRMASRHSQRRLIRARFTVTIAGPGPPLALPRADSAVWTFGPGSFLTDLELEIMLTASVNVVSSMAGARPGRHLRVSPSA